MSDPYLGEIRIMSFQFAPRGWAQCNGQILPINQNQALFAILGTTFGGNGQTTFALPDLRGQVPVHAAATRPIGSAGGVEAVSLTTGQIPAHSHTLAVSAQRAALDDPTAAYWAADTAAHFAPTGTGAMAGSAIGVTGASQPHENRQPSLTVNFVIALVGIFPSRD